MICWYSKLKRYNKTLKISKRFELLMRNEGDLLVASPLRKLCDLEVVKKQIQSDTVAAAEARYFSDAEIGMHPHTNATLETRAESISQAQFDGTAVMVQIEQEYSLTPAVMWVVLHFFLATRLILFVRTLCDRIILLSPS